MSSQFKRILIDSRHKDPESLSDSDFYCTIPYPVLIPAGSTLYVDSVLLSHSWQNVDVDQFQRIYVHEVVAGVTTPRILFLDAGDYNLSSLRTEVQAKLNSGTHLSGHYVVSESNGKLTFTNNTTGGDYAKIFGLADINADDFPATFGTGLFYPLRPAAELLGLMKSNSVQISAGTSLTGEFVDLQPHKRLLLSCPGLGETSYVGLRGSTDVIRSILVGNSLTGDVVQDSLNHTASGVEFKADTVIQKLHFILRSANSGHVLNLNSHQISFEMVIVHPGK